MVQDPDLHSQLAEAYADQLVACLANESTSKLWRAKGKSVQPLLLSYLCELTRFPASSYFSGRSESSYISYFASTTPESESKRTRLKAILFLQGSTLYDPAAVRTRLSAHAKILKLELAILEGKVRLILSSLTSHTTVPFVYSFVNARHSSATTAPHSPSSCTT